jgi:hypothetical protein
MLDRRGIEPATGIKGCYRSSNHSTFKESNELPKHLAEINKILLHVKLLRTETQAWKIPNGELLY